MRPRALRLIVVACLLVPLAGCADEAGIGATASAVLTPHVRTTRTAASAGERDKALGELAALRLKVAELRSADELSEAGAHRVLGAAADVESRLELLPAPAPTAASAPTRPSAPVGGGGDKAGEDARKRAEEAAKKAEEEAKKQVEDARKRAEEARKRAEEAAKEVEEEAKRQAEDAKKD